MGVPKREYESGARGPLDGVRILDLSRLVAGNTLTQVLCDFGAGVIKVEPPAGDTLRGWKTEGIETNWKLYARGKKSLGLDLRNPQARELLLAANPRLVIARISGFGQTGPYRRRPGFGTLVEGMSGFASFNGFADREPVLPPIYLADSVAGLYGAIGVMVALREVEANGGNGQVIDLPLLDPLFAVLGPQAANFRLTGKVKPRTGSRSTNSGPRNAYRCKDGLYVGLSASTQKMAERTLRAIGREDLVDDPRFRTNANRVKNAEPLDAIIGEFIAQRTQAENVAFFEQAEVTIGPIYDIRQILEDPHFQAREVLADYPDEEMGVFPMHAVAPRLSRTPGKIRAPAPHLGQHNREVLAEIGVDDARYAQLLADGVVIEGERPGSPA